MSRSIKPRKYGSHGYVSQRTPKLSILKEVVTQDVGKSAPRHSIRSGRHCPCCLSPGQKKTLKQTTSRALRRKVKQTLKD